LLASLQSWITIPFLRADIGSKIPALITDLEKSEDSMVDLRAKSGQKSNNQALRILRCEIQSHHQLIIEVL